ncbi:hypothetical protein NDU88_003571 [Pleurodeles waltl]|uniref:Retrotransposon gag domain-containing protein n=1 Tax=Pleurodeles waltl TaxID=8319 RepID=A0AAV7TPG7_PLEWA|nr:hypothetical protein NDU88_003571 [Pleurodeles waltl]
MPKSCVGMTTYGAVPPEAEAHHIFKYLPEISDDDGQPLQNVFDEAKLRLEKRFSKEENIVMSRYKFYTRPQREGESLDDFISSLQDLSVKCKFGTRTDKLIRDQLIVHCRSKNDSRAVMGGKNPFLKDAIGIAKIVEESELCMKEISKKDIISGEGDVALTSKKILPLRVAA